MADDSAKLYIIRGGKLHRVSDDVAIEHFVDDWGGPVLMIENSVPV